MNTEDIVVIGGGLIGSAVAWQLSKRGEQVLLLEQQNQEYAFGSSFGEARICRSLGPRNDIWSYLHNQAVIETKELVAFLNKESPLDHSMEDVYTTGPVTYVLYSDEKNAVRRMLTHQTDPYEVALTSEESKAKFDMVIPENAVLIKEFKEFSGTINPKALISKLHEAIRLKGNTVQYNQKVTDIKKENELYSIDTTDTKTGESVSIKAKRVVSSAGPYTGSLLKNIAPEVSELITPKRVFLAFFKIDPLTYRSYSSDQKEKINSCYPMIDLGPDHIFAMIEKYEDEVPIIKIGGHYNRSEISDLDEVWKKEVTQSEIEWSREQTMEYFQMMDIPIQADDLIHYHDFSCVYSLTESEVPIVDHIRTSDGQADSNFILMGGFSGVGAKGSLAYGVLASDLLLNNDNLEAMYQKTKKALVYLKEDGRKTRFKSLR